MYIVWHLEFEFTYHALSSKNSKEATKIAIH